jgi:hypothetical protein
LIDQANFDYRLRMTPATNGENSTPAHTRFARLEGNQAIERAESDLAEAGGLNPLRR